MITALTVAVVIQWVVLLALCAIVVVLLRQIGMLHERLGPVGALTLPGGPKAGDLAPEFSLAALDGRIVAIGGPDRGNRPTLLFFLSPTCPMCKTLLPILKSIAREEHETVQIVLASDGDEALQHELIQRHGLEQFPFILSTKLGLAYEVSKLPHAVLIAPDGRIVAKGLVNNREHLESLFEARRHGVASLQDYMARENSSSSTDVFRKAGA